MRKFITSSIASVFIASVCGLFASSSALSQEGEVGVCQVPTSLKDTLALSDVKISFAERQDGYAIYVSSDNLARKDLIKAMIFDLLKAKSEWNSAVNNGYGLLNDE